MHRAGSGRSSQSRALASVSVTTKSRQLNRLGQLGKLQWLGRLRVCRQKEEPEVEAWRSTPLWGGRYCSDACKR